MKATNLSTLETLGLPFLILSAELELAHLSTSALKAIGLENRESWDGSSDHFEPLLRVVRNTLGTGNFTLEPNHNSFSVVQITDCFKTTVPVLFSSSFLADLPSDPEVAPGHMVFFLPVSSLHSMFLNHERVARTRAFVILSAALFGDIFEAHAVKQLDRAELFTFANITNEPIEAIGGTDLLELLTKCVSLTDQLILPTIRISFDTKAPALLRLPWVAGFRIISHVLMEAADFAAPAGTISVRTVLPQGEAIRKGPNPGENYIELVVTAERMTPITHTALDEYVFTKLTPHQYKVRVADDEPELAASAAFEKGVHRAHDLPIDLCRIPEETLSEDLRLATSLARDNRCALQARKLAPQLLALYAQLPIC